jgi:hypothetical protein
MGKGEKEAKPGKKEGERTGVSSMLRGTKRKRIRTCYHQYCGEVALEWQKYANILANLDHLPSSTIRILIPGSIELLHRNLAVSWLEGGCKTEVGDRMMSLSTAGLGFIDIAESVVEENKDIAHPLLGYERYESNASHQDRRLLGSGVAYSIKSSSSSGRFLFTDFGLVNPCLVFVLGVVGVGTPVPGSSSSS